MDKIRLLKEDEIECRVQSINDKGCVLLLYKDARTDMNILDETFGNENWQRTHEVINGNLFCNIEIWDKDKKCWIKKQDVGVESKTEAQKGEASDAFKRAGFNVGIGRELYTAPFIWINLSPDEITKRGDKAYLKYKVKFSVAKVEYKGRTISNLLIVDQDLKERYRMGSAKPVVKETIKEELNSALEGVTKCKDLNSLEDLWNMFPNLWTIKKFKDSVKLKKTELE